MRWVIVLFVATFLSACVRTPDNPFDDIDAPGECGLSRPLLLSSSEVVFHRADGTVFDEQNTGNLDGTAVSGDCEPGTMITYRFPGRNVLVTFADVDPGTIIELQQPPPVDPFDPFFELNVMPPVPPGAEKSFASAGCGVFPRLDPPDPTVLPINGNCFGVDDGTVDLVAFSRTGMGIITGWSTAYDIAVEMGTVGDPAIATPPLPAYVLSGRFAQSLNDKLTLETVFVGGRVDYYRDGVRLTSDEELHDANDPPDIVLARGPDGVESRLTYYLEAQTPLVESRTERTFSNADGTEDISFFAPITDFDVDFSEGLGQPRLEIGPALIEDAKKLRVVGMHGDAGSWLLVSATGSGARYPDLPQGLEEYRPRDPTRLTLELSQYDDLDYRQRLSLGFVVDGFDIRLVEPAQWVTRSHLTAQATLPEPPEL